MISRVAENCFWMSRYLERSENTARVLDVNRTLLMDLDLPVEQQWRPLLIISGIHDYAGSIDGESVQEFMTWDAANFAGLSTSIAAVRENARTTRDVISTDMWERINHYYLWVGSADARTLYARNRPEFYGQVRRINQLIHGIAEGTMSHGEAWEFFRLGKYLERGCWTARILDVKYHVVPPRADGAATPTENAHWTAILTSCSAYEPFLKTQRGMADANTAVAEFLVFDPQFPRSVIRCLEECRASLHAISGRPVGRPENVAERRLQALLDLLGQISVDGIIESGLHDVLTAVVDSFHEIGNAVHRTYFDVQVQLPPGGATAAVAAQKQA
jgi:uncharacterized alpha-E superfamily protein